MASEMGHPWVGVSDLPPAQQEASPCLGPLPASSAGRRLGRRGGSSCSGAEGSWPAMGSAKWGASLWHDSLSPFMPHEEALSIVQRSTAVLDTFPWGMGVTAFEAFSVCTPVLTVPSMTAVLQLTLGQYHQKETTDTDGQRRDDDGSSSTESVRRSSGGTSMALREMICRSKRRLFEDWEAVEELGRFLERAVCAALL
ncbi:unnamed protein product [Heterosigma akashiwo]